MDNKLRRLKRAAQADPSIWPMYAAALERVLGFSDEDDPELLRDEKIATVFSRKLPLDDFHHMIRVARDIGGCPVDAPFHEHTIAYVVDVEWKSTWGGDEEDIEHLPTSHDLDKILAKAKRQGFRSVMLWLE